MDTNYFDKIRKINCLSNDMEAIYHQAAVKLEISDSALLILYMIHDLGDKCLPSDICRLTGISKQTVNSALRKLEADEILFLQPHNGRTKQICLTDRGQEYISRTAAKLFEAECRALQSWSEEEIDSYLRLMEKYNVTLRSQIEKL